LTAVTLASVAADSGFSGKTGQKADDTPGQKTETPPSANTFPQPNPNAHERSTTERLAPLRAELDRLEREARDGNTKTDPRRVAELTAAEDAARALERES